MRITASEAYQLLLKDVVCSVEDWNRPENRWVKHCVYVGEAAGRIAECLGVDSDFAKALGYVHDIGRKVSHPRHVIEGYSYLMKLGLDEMAGSCLTHSFIDNDIHLTAGGPLRTDTEAFVAPYLNSHPATIYDNIDAIYGSVEDARLAANLLFNIPEEWETAFTYFKKVIDSSQADGDSYLKAGEILEQHLEFSDDAYATAMSYYKSAWEKGIPAGARGMGRLWGNPEFKGASRADALNCFNRALEQEPEATILDARKCLQIDESLPDEYIKDWLSFFEKGIHLQQPAAALTIASCGWPRKLDNLTWCKIPVN